MALEIPAQVRLVGKAQPVGYLLYAQFAGLQQYFDFEDGMIVYDLLGRTAAGSVPADPREVFGGDAKAVGIVRDLALDEAVFVNEGNELFEKLVLAVVSLHIFLGEVAVHFIVHIEQEALQMVAGDLIAERVVVVGVDCGGSCQQSVDGGDMIIWQRIARLLFEEVKESGLEAETGFAKQIAVGGKVRYVEVIAPSFEAEHSAGQEHDLRVAYYLVPLKVDKYLPPAVAAENDDDAIQLVEPALKSCHVAGSRHKRAFT